MKSFEILITSPFDREYLVAEIWSNSDLVAEINQETDELEIEFYTNEKITFNLNAFLEALQNAKIKLMNK